jgi:rhamnosyltransferase subunit B
MTLRTELLMASVGSAGDIHPFIAVGHAMVQRGHAVAMFSHAPHQQAIESAGLEYVDAGPTLDYEACVQSAQLWHPVKGMGVLWRALLAPSIAPLYKVLQQRQHSNLRVLAGPQMLGARLAQEHLGTALTTAYTAPSMLRSCLAPTTIAHTSWPRGTPRWLLRRLWQAVDHYKLEPMARPYLDKVCAQLQISPVQSPSIFGQWMHAASGITLFPDWFAPPKADYPAALQYGDFPRYTLDAPSTLSAELQQFLAQGSAPVVVMLGTAMAHAAAQFAVWQAALQRANLRGIFLSGHASQLPRVRTDSIFYAEYTPFTTLLPHCSAIVHHGGIGTCAQAMAAGIPQIIQACAHDQFENARNVNVLGVGQRLARDASLDHAVKALQFWCQNPVHIHALTYVQQQSSVDGLSKVCDLLESSWG